MPIEFRCPGCARRLRTADETAGKQAKCPGCGAVLTIPQAGAAEGESYGLAPPPAPLPSQSESWSRPAQPVGGAVPGFSENPFASPLSSSAPSAPAATMTDRAGPPWERDGASLASFIGTLKQLYTSPSAMFSEMLRGGSLWMPLGFAICGGMCGGLFNLIYDAVLPDPFQNPGIGGPNAGPGAGPGGALVFPCFLVIGPLIISAIVLVLALIMHGILLALGGANFPFVATLRPVAYGWGGTAFLQIVPYVGPFIMLIVLVVFSIIGLSKIHEISNWKSAAAVLTPVVLCCGGLFALGVLLGIAVAMQGQF